MAIILIGNMSVEGGHCNGTRGKIEHLSPYFFIQARKLLGGDNSVILIPQILPNQQRSEPQVLLKAHAPLFSAT
jgi:hypothetical protein